MDKDEKSEAMSHLRQLAESVGMVSDLHPALKKDSFLPLNLNLKLSAESS